MTVKELIDELSRCDPQMPAMISDGNLYSDVDSVLVHKVDDDMQKFEAVIILGVESL